MADKVVGEHNQFFKMFYVIDGQLAEITRQLRQKSGYPFSLEMLRIHLWNGTRGIFVVDEYSNNPKFIPGEHFLEKYYDIRGYMEKIMQQLRQGDGYPFSLEMLRRHLQNSIEGNFLSEGPKEFYPESLSLADFFKKVSGCPYEVSIWRGSEEDFREYDKKEQDMRSNLLRTIPLNSLSFETCMEEGAVGAITGEEKLIRLKGLKKSILGKDAFYGLWKNYKEREEYSILEWLWKKHRISYLDFFGTIIRNSEGKRVVICLSRSDDRWRYHLEYLFRPIWWTRHPSLVSNKVPLIFSICS